MACNKPGGTLSLVAPLAPKAWPCQTRKNHPATGQWTIRLGRHSERLEGSAVYPMQTGDWNAKSYFTFDGKPRLNLHTQQFSESSGKLTAHLPTLLEWFPQTGVRSDAGELTYNGTFSGGLTQGAPFSCVGTLDWPTLMDSFRTTREKPEWFGSVGLRVDKEQRLKIQRLEGDAQLAENLDAKLDLRGDWNLRTGQFAFKKLNDSGGLGVGADVCFPEVISGVECQPYCEP